MTNVAPRQPSARLLAIVAIGSVVILGGFVWVMANLTAVPAPQATPSAGRAVMAAVSGRLGTDRNWTIGRGRASLIFGQATYVVNDVDGPTPYLVVDITDVAPEARQTAAGRAADVALAVAQASDHQADRYELSRRLSDQAANDVRTINGFELHITGSALTIRPPAG